MIHFGVVADDRADFGEIADGLDARNEFTLEPVFYRIDENISGISLDQKGIIGGAASRFVAVEIAQIPVDGANPPDALGDFYCFKRLICHDDSPLIQFIAA